MLLDKKYSNPLQSVVVLFCSGRYTFSRLIRDGARQNAHVLTTLRGFMEGEGGGMGQYIQSLVLVVGTSR